MKKQLILFAVALLLLSGCKVDLDTHAVDRFRIIEAGGMVLRLNTETGEVARITDAGIVQLSDAPPGTLPPRLVRQTEQLRRAHQMPSQRQFTTSPPARPVPV